MKNRFKISSVRSRASLTIIILALLSLLISGLIVSRLVEREITKNYEIEKATTIEGLSYALEPMMESYDYAEVERPITAALKHRYIASIAVYDIQGTLISSVEEEVAASAAVNPETYTISGDGGVVGRLEIGIYTGYISDQVRSTILVLTSGLAIIFIIGGFLFSGLFNRFITRPLSYLSEKVTEMTPENLTVRIEQTKEDEFGTLAKSINKMAKRLQEHDVASKKVELELRDSQEKLYRIISSITDGISVTDLNGTITEVNDAILKLGKFNSKDIIVGRNSFESIDPSDRKKALDNIQKLVQRGTVGRGEYTLLRADGSRYPAEITANVLKGTNGNIVGFVSVIRDITERKQTEEKLRQSQESYRALFDSSVIGTIVLDAETMRIAIANNVAAKIFGFNSVEEGIGENPLDFVSPEDRERAHELIVKDLFEQDLRTTHELRAITKDAREIWISITGARITHEGRLAGLISFTDITERKQAEAALLESEARFRDIFESASDGIIVAELETKKFFTANKAMCRMLGYSLDEVRNLGVTDIHPEKDLPYVLGQFEKQSRGEITLSGDIPVKRKDGSVFYVDVNAFALQFGGKRYMAGFFRDVTERKQAEEALRQSEEHYKALFDSAVIGTIVVDGGTVKVVMANQVAAKMFGFSSVDEMIGTNAFDFIPPEGKERVIEIARKEIAQDLRPTHEFRAITKDGREIWTSITGARIMHKGRLAALVSFTDITERKQAEEALQKSEENYRTLFENTVVGTVVLDAETLKVVLANQAALKMFGFSSIEEAREVNPFDFIVPEDREAYLGITRNALFEQDLQKLYDLRAVTKNGREIWINVTAARIMHEGKLAGLVSFTDVIERKRAEEALRQSEERYRTILEEMEDSYFEVDLGGHVSFINNAGCRHLGYSIEELIGKSYKDFTAEDEIESVFQVFNEVYRTGVPNKGFRWKIIRKDGSAGSIDSSVSPLRNDKSEIIGFRGIGRDVTERMKMEEQLLIADRLASVGELASGIAHELNNPLTGIIGLSQLLTKKDIPDDSKEDLQLVYSEAQRAANVVRGLLSFARKHSPDRQPININDVIIKVLELRDYEQKVNNIERVINLAPDLPLVLADYFQMQQVFLNIVTNAEYFMLKAHNKGTLTITTETMEDIVRISFADDGPGIPEKDWGRVFDPFFTTKEVGKGTGLGLSISHGIVIAHGGRIYVKSEQGKGATFIVELPIRKEEGSYEDSD